MLSPPKLLPLLSPAECTHFQLPSMCLLSVIYMGLKCIYFCTLLFFTRAKGPDSCNGLVPTVCIERGSWGCRAGLSPQTPVNEAKAKKVTAASWVRVWPGAVLVYTMALFSCPAQGQGPGLLVSGLRKEQN